MAELQKKMIQFGIDKVYIVPLLKDDASGVQYGTNLMRLEGVQDLKITETSSDYTLQGDNGTVDIITITEGYEVEISYGGLTFEQLVTIKGGEIIEETDGETPANVIKRRYVNKNTDKSQYFGLIGVIENSNTKVILGKVKAISVEIPYSNLTHAVVNVKAKALKREFDGVMRIQDQELNATPAAVTDLEITSN